MNLLLVDRRQDIIAHLRRDQVIRHIPIIAFQPPGHSCSEQEAIEELAAGFDMVLCDHRYREWLAIFKAMLRRQELSAGPIREFRANQLYMNLDRHEVLVEGRPIKLTAKEFQILQLFLEQCGRVVTRQALLDRVWGEEFEIEEHALDVHIHALRQKLQVTPSFPRMILTVRGIGYKLSSA
jgi:DNA-binding response OmpR family regulator